jgi:hypothetical protein
MTGFFDWYQKNLQWDFSKANRFDIFEDTSVTIKVIYPKKLNTYGDDTM